ncbi:Sad1 / UNC-like protein [Oesophagostomum dentatum]|uniref:Sad1 / UNC-like protein n=1 Tax=Oesophagostomum dentatum TaxID=61180 RepID=A0A0B1SRK7_OESDE|nr:Sad1 / UNC-like protein [Oesophagostomum dentatum]
MDCAGKVSGYNVNGCPSESVEVATVMTRPTALIFNKKIEHYDYVENWTLMEVHHRGVGKLQTVVRAEHLGQDHFPLYMAVIETQPDYPVKIIEMEVTSNYGAEYTSLYRLRVHGSLWKPGSE